MTNSFMKNHKVCDNNTKEDSLIMGAQKLEHLDLILILQQDFEKYIGGKTYNWITNEAK